MTRIIRQATRERAWTRTRLMGASNSGKTLGSLLIALGLTGGRWENGRAIGGRMEHVVVIDTEKERSRLFAPAFGNRFDVLPLDPPFSPERYIEAMNDVQREGAVDGQPYEVIIIDSGTHEWAGPGGVLSEIDRIKKTSKNRDEQYAVWGILTPRHDAFIEACIIRPAAHVIFCTRAKGEYEDVQVGNQKKRVKVGLVDIQREGMEFEFTFGFRLEGDHLAYVEKDTSLLPNGGSLFDGQPPFVIGTETGRKILEWLELGAGTLPQRQTSDQQPPLATPPPAPLGGVTATMQAEEDATQTMRAELLGLFKVQLKTEDRAKLVDGLAKASKAILPTGEELRSFKSLSRLEVETILKAVKRAPDAVAWYDIAQQREIPKPTPAAPTSSLFDDQRAGEEPLPEDAVEELGPDDELGI